MTTATSVQKEFPGPKGWPIVGNLFQFETDVLHTYLNLQKKYGDRYKIKLGPLDSVVLSHPDDVHHVLVKNQKNYIKGIGYRSFRLLVGQGLVTSEGDLWRRQRRLMQPSFTPAATTQFFEMMVEITERMLDRWEPLARQGHVLQVDTQMRQLTMSVIGRAMFGIDLGEESSVVGNAFQTVFELVPERVRSISLPLVVPTPHNRLFRKNLAIIDDFVNAQIAAGRRETTGENLLGILLRLRDEETQEQMTEQQLRDEVVTLFFAGFETTARSLTWAWYLLARHPEIAEKLAQEAESVLAGQNPTIPDLFNLTYTRQVVDETLRLYPPTALLARQNLEADEIGGYTITPKTMVILIPYLVHRYTDMWENPEQFDPERFSVDASGQRPKSAYIPFASGPRVCLGNNFALMEMVLALSMASARYRLSPIDDRVVPWEFAGTIRPKRAIDLRLHLRSAVPAT